MLACKGATRGGMSLKVNEAYPQNAQVLLDRKVVQV
jgi:hypothetical protein